MSKVDQDVREVMADHTPLGKLNPPYHVLIGSLKVGALSGKPPFGPFFFSCRYIQL